jgi:hypothetical protein
MTTNVNSNMVLVSPPSSSQSVKECQLLTAVSSCSFLIIFQVLLVPSYLLDRTRPAFHEILAELYLVSPRWRPITAAPVRSLVSSFGTCGGQSGIRGGFLRVPRFPLPILIPSPYSSAYNPGWYHRSSSDRRTIWTESHPTKG